MPGCSSKYLLHAPRSSTFDSASCFCGLPVDNRWWLKKLNSCHSQAWSRWRSRRLASMWPIWLQWAFWEWISGLRGCSICVWLSNTVNKSGIHSATSKLPISKMHLKHFKATGVRGVDLIAKRKIIEKKKSFSQNEILSSAHHEFPVFRFPT